MAARPRPSMDLSEHSEGTAEVSRARTDSCGGMDDTHYGGREGDGLGESLLDELSLSPKIFTRVTEGAEVKLDDFTILTLLGEGGFGKARAAFLLRRGPFSSRARARRWSWRGRRATAACSPSRPCGRRSSCTPAWAPCSTCSTRTRFCRR